MALPAGHWWRLPAATTLFALLVSAFPIALHADVCVTGAHYQVVAWHRVIDGDTLQLADGRRVRLIGVNAPELAHEGRSIQPFAVLAKRAVETFLAGSSTLRLVVGERRRDHYGRLLAHVYRSSDGASLEELLLRQGLAFAIAIGPDVAFADCLGDAERPARTAGRGVWSEPQFFPGDDDASLRPGFALVQTRVTAVVPGRNQWWIETSGDLALRVASSDLDYFDRRWLAALTGRQVRVRGWLISRRHSAAVRRGHAPWMMSLRHPADLEFVVPR